jgi:hypothetical protein
MEVINMVSVAKCMGIMSTLGLATGAGASYYAQNKVNKITMKQAEIIAQHNGGSIPTGGKTKDGKLWDGKMTLDEFKKNLNKKTAILSLMTGTISALGVAILSGLTLLLRGKVKP